MSYLTELKHKQIDVKTFLAKSVRYLKEKVGLTVTDEVVDEAVRAADVLTDVIETGVKAYIASTLPQLPAEIATAIATQVLASIDIAIAGAGNVIKANN